MSTYSDDDIPREKLRISFAKVTYEKVMSTAHPSEGAIGSIDESGNEIAKEFSEASFILENENGKNKHEYDKIVVIKPHHSNRASEDDERRAIIENHPTEISKSDEEKDNLLYSFSKNPYEYAKEEETSSINDIFYKIENPATHLSTGSCETNCKVNRVSSLFSKPGISSVRSREGNQAKMCLNIRREQRDETLDTNRKRRLDSVVRALDLPVSLPKGPNVESSPKFEKLILETHVVASSTTMLKQVIPVQSETISYLSKTTTTGTNTERPAVEGISTSSPFELRWCYGFNADVPVINISDESSSKVLMANSQYAVIYDFHEDTMSFLQGHLNTLSCLAANTTGDILVTADSGTGETCRVIIWDRRSCPLQVLDNVHPHGCQQVGVSGNGEVLVTVSAYETPICIKVWECNLDTKIPSASTTVKESIGSVIKLTTHPASKSAFAVTFDRVVLFVHFTWQSYLGEASEEGAMSEKIKECDFVYSVSIPLKLGNLTDTTFVEDTETRALSSTSKGYVIVWENNINPKHKRGYEKYVRLHLNRISIIQSIDNMIAVATDCGSVSFYDADLKILFFHKLHQEPLISLSFNPSIHNANITCGTHPSCANTWRREPTKLVDASLASNPFAARHYVVCTESGKLAYVNASCGTPKYLPFPDKEMFTAMDILPHSKYLCAGTASGKCMLFDTNRRKVKLTHKIKVPANLCQAVSFLKYSHSGFTLACAMYTGAIWFLDPILLTPVFEHPLTDSSYCITELLFTPNSEYLLVTDVRSCISAYCLEEKPTLIGQYVAHYKPIATTIVEADESNDKEIKILTLSYDRSVCHFIIDKERKSFEFLRNYRVEQDAVPMCSVKYPIPNVYLGINDEGKFKLHEVSQTNLGHIVITKRCRGTYQAPEFGSLINYMEIFYNNLTPYLFFRTNNHLGIHLLPIDGNPFKALGFRASPTPLTRCKIDPEGKYVYTISDTYGGISMWKINIKAVVDFHESGGEGMEPFLRILGEEKEREVRDFFDLGQFLHQGESPNLVRTLNNHLPLCEVANVLLALGCHLTKHEIGEVTAELLSSSGKDNPDYTIEYDDFIRMYLNHRRTNDMKIDELRNAFRDFYTGVYYASNDPEVLDKWADTAPIFDADYFMQKLLVTGEELTLEELYADFSILTGGQPESPGTEELLIFQVPPTMPKKISFEIFVKDILGFQIEDSDLKGTRIPQG